MIRRMTPEEIGSRLGGLVPGAQSSVSGGEEFVRATVDVPPHAWAGAVRAARDDPELAMDFFDWLSAVDEQAQDGSAGADAIHLRVVAHLWSTTARHGVLLRTWVGDDPVVPSVVDLYPGAAWHERETHEMFGVWFEGHPDLAPLLLAPEFEGRPLRKDFVLASRVAKPWPGAKEPGESHAARRAPMRPPGVPDPTRWGPQAAGREE
jgi:NADH-quinone oxidoreductase subunit C